MNVFPHFYGNDEVARVLQAMAQDDRVPQTILLSGPDGVGKATLARRFGAALLGDEDKIERDDLSLPANSDYIEEREKWTAEKRGDDPLLFSTHPDFVTFAPEGPLKQITVQQMRALRERAQFKPLSGVYRVFLIDHLERANEQAANSLLKIMEEPPEHLILIATVQNLYDLLPTIRSRAVVFQLGRLADDEMLVFARNRGLQDAETRVSVSEGCPGVAARIDLEQFRMRRSLMLSVLECGAGLLPFSEWVGQSESFASRKNEKLELYLRPGYDILEDVLIAGLGGPPRRNQDLQARVTALARKTDLQWIENAAKALDELVLMVRRNIQKTSALDAMIIKLQSSIALTVARPVRT